MQLNASFSQGEFVMTLKKDGVNVLRFNGDAEGRRGRPSVIFSDLTEHVLLIMWANR